MDSISITIKPEDVDNTILDSSIYSEMEPISTVLKSEIKEETNLDHYVPQSDETSCDLKTDVEEKTKSNSLFVDAISTLNGSVTSLDAINVHKNSCTNKSSKQDKNELIKEANQKLFEMKQSAEKRLRDVLGEEVLQIAAFQQKSCICSLKQAAVTRFSTKSDEMQDKQVNVQKDHSELVKQLMTQSTEDRPRNILGEQVLQMKDKQVNVQKDHSELVKQLMTGDQPRNILREQVLQMQDKQVNVQKDPSELEKEPMTQSVEHRPRNVIGEQDLQMQGSKRDEQSTDDIHRILHKDQVLQMLVKQIGVQNDPGECVKESMTQSTEDWLRNMLREQDLQMQDKQVNVQKDRSELLKKPLIQLAEDRPRNMLREKDLQMQDKQVNVQKDPSERVKESMIQSAEDRHENVCREQVLQMQDKPVDVQKDLGELVKESMTQWVEDRHRNVHREQDNVQSRKRYEESTKDIHRNLHKDQVLQMQDKQVDVQKNPGKPAKEPMTQSVEDRPRNVHREQDHVHMRSRKQEVQRVSKQHSDTARKGHAMAYRNLLSLLLAPSSLSSKSQSQSFRGCDTRDHDDAVAMETPKDCERTIGNRSPGCDTRNHDDAVAMETTKDGERTRGNRSLARVIENEIKARVMENQNQACSMEADEQIVHSQKTPETIEEIAITESDSEDEPRSEKTVVDSALKQKGVMRPKGVKRQKGVKGQKVNTLEEIAITESDSENEPSSEKTVVDSALKQKGVMRPKGVKRQKGVKRKKGVKGQKEFICDTCNMKFTRHVLICNHVLTHLHNGRLFACRRCFKKFTTLQERNLHEKTHNDRNPVICDKCGVQFPSTTYLFSHEIKVHGKSKPYLCHLCGKSFYTRKDLQKHGLVHAKLDKLVDHGKEVSYLCDTCGKSFKQRSDLNRHGLVHSGEKNFECKHCNKRFSSPLGLKHHLKTHQKVACDICSETFEGKKRLLRHKMIHNKKAYQCDQCEASFDQNCNLTKHKIIHSGLKPYKCHICEYSAAHRSNLNKHLKMAHNLTPNS